MANSLLFFDDLKAVGRVPVEILKKYSPPFEIEPRALEIAFGWVKTGTWDWTEESSVENVGDGVEWVVRVYSGGWIQSWWISWSVGFGKRARNILCQGTWKIRLLLTRVYREKTLWKGLALWGLCWLIITICALSAINGGTF